MLIYILTFLGGLIIIIDFNNQYENTFISYKLYKAKMSRKMRSLNFDFDKMRDLSRTSPKYIKIQQHPEEDLLLFNYTPHTQYNKYWTPETLCARGLITDLEGNIVAFPFPKFFNLHEYDDELPELPFEVYEKMDGSLGIIYFVNGEPRIATRGSFESDQGLSNANSIESEHGKWKN